MSEKLSCDGCKLQSESGCRCSKPKRAWDLSVNGKTCYIDKKRWKEKLDRNSGCR